jgi:hypothetical protein
MPGKSVNILFVLAYEDEPRLASTVLPGKFAVALRSPHNRLNNVVFPTFGLPRSKMDLAALGCTTGVVITVFF